MASETAPPPRFFVLENADGGSHDTGFTRLGDDVGAAPRCPRCGDIIGKRPWLPPYRVTLELYGEHFADVIKGFGGKLLVTERVAEAFRAEGLTGLQGFHPVEVARVRRQRRGPRPSAVPAYFYVTPVFGSAAVDEAHSRIQRSESISCDVCRMTGVDAIHGFTLEQASWNGDDVFIARGLPGTLIVSERFARFVARHGFTHLRLTPTEQYIWPAGPPHPRGQEEARLIKQGCTRELWRTIKPDIVLHADRDLLRSVLTLDFKFPCPATNEPQWTRYGEKSAYTGSTQGRIYKAALGGETLIISPLRGVIP